MGNKVVNDVSNSTIRNPNSALPEGWWWVRLGEVCQFEYGTGLPEHDRQKGNVPVYGSNGIVGYHSVSITEGPAIVIGRKGSIGQAHYSSVACWPIDTTYYVDASKTSCDLQWLFFLIKWMRLDAFNRATGVPGLNRNDAYSQVISLPPLLEQKRVAAKVQELMKDIEYACTACEVQLEAAKTLPSSYLRQVFESEEAKKWERRKLGEVCEIFSGSSAPQDAKYFENGKYPFVRVQDLGRYRRTTNLVDIKDYINDSAIKDFNLVKAERGAILFPKSGAAITTNNRAMLGIDAFIVSHLAALKAKKGIGDNYFIYYWLCLIDMVQYLENPGYPSLKLSTVSKLSIPLPPLNIQQRIALELKGKMAQVEKLRTGIEKQLEDINALPQAILRKAFSGEL